MVRGVDALGLWDFGEGVEINLTKTGREGMTEGMGRSVVVLNPDLREGDNTVAKRHDGCEIQLLEGEDTHTLGQSMV